MCLFQIHTLQKDLSWRRTRSFNAQSSAKQGLCEVRQLLNEQIGRMRSSASDIQPCSAAALRLIGLSRQKSPCTRADVQAATQPRAALRQNPYETRSKCMQKNNTKTQKAQSDPNARAHTRPPTSHPHPNTRHPHIIQYSEEGVLVHCACLRGGYSNANSSMLCLKEAGQPPALMY